MLILVALLVLIAPLRSLAGDSFLDRSKVREAVPYGTSIEQRPSKENAAPPSMPQRESGQPSSTAPPSTIPDDASGGRDRR